MILNRQRGVRVRVRLLNEFHVKMCEALRLSPNSLSICLVGDEEIATWNQTYRGKRGPTDVLSFGSEENGNGRRRVAKARGARKRRLEATEEYLGDIAIAPAVAKRNAAQFGRTFDDEMRILMLHGALHLMGYDHETDTGQMDRRERRMRRVLGLN